MSKSSVAWDFFTLTDDKVKCGLCRVTMKHNSSSTSNMMRHLRLKHVTVDLSRRRILDEEVDDPSTAEPASSSNLVSTYPPIVVFMKLSIIYISVRLVTLLITLAYYVL